MRYDEESLRFRSSLDPGDPVKKVNEIWRFFMFNMMNDAIVA